jgi:hypothetical protein
MWGTPRTGLEGHSTALTVRIYAGYSQLEYGSIDALSLMLG